MQVPFVKGHMGGNTIALFRQGSFPRNRELEPVLQALRNDRIACHEAGLVSPCSSKDRLSLSIVGRSSRNWISSCGGLTQVLGRTLTDRASCEHLGIPSFHSPATVMLETPAGPTPISIDGEGEETTVRTDMTAFVKELLRDGFEEMTFQDIPVRRIGKFLTIDAEGLERFHPNHEIETLGAGVRQTLIRIQKDFFTHLGRESRDFALYDGKPSADGDFRITFPHYLPENHIEPACGTGTVAAGIALFLDGRLTDRSQVRNGQCGIVFESGDGPSLGGPELTTLFLRTDNGRLLGAEFSHNRVELTTVGEVILPEGNTGR